MKRTLVLIVLFSCLLLAGCKGDNSTGKSAPKISGVSPALVNPGQTNIEGRIYGSNLHGMMTVNLGDGIDIDSAAVLNDGEIYVHYSVQDFAAPGPRTVSVYSSDGVATASNLFTVDDNRLPDARFRISPGVGYKATLFTFNASGSSDDGGIVNYQWQFGDGRAGNGRVVTHKFDRAGKFRIVLTVTDNRGATAVSTDQLTVDPSRSPIARFTVSPSSGDTGTTFRFDASGSRDLDGQIRGYSWNFGDGSSATGQTAQHHFAAAGTYGVTLTVTDNTRMQGQVMASVSVQQGGGGDDGGGGGELCTGMNYNGQPFTVVAVSGNTITGDVAFETCPGKCGEVRRNASGIREFVGDVVSINGSSLTFNPASLPASCRPVVGEQLKVIWRNCG